MSKKNKKHTQQNLSLKERLAKRWEKRDWSAFIELFMRDINASLRSPMALYWHDALYNCLTSALFVDKDLKSAEMAVALILAESEKGRELPAFLNDCTQVALGFLNAHSKKAQPTVSVSLLEEDALPEPYASLRRGMAVIGATFTKATKATKVKKGALLTSAEKLAKQYSALGQGKGKGLTPYTQCLKTAQALEDATVGLDCAPTLRAVRIIVALVRELHGSVTSRERLRDPLDLSRHYLFREMPHNLANPLVLGLWNSFCRMGGEKYGEGWEETASVTLIPHLAGCDSLKKVYQILLEKKISKNNFGKILPDANSMLRDKINELVDSDFPWLEQDLYILKTLSIILHREIPPSPDNQADLSQFLLYFKSIGTIGEKWSQNFSWHPDVENALNSFLSRSSKKAARAIFQSGIPPKVLNSRILLLCFIVGGCTLQELNELNGKHPLTLSKNDITILAKAISKKFPPLSVLRDMMNLLTKSDRATLTVCWLYKTWGAHRSEKNLFASDDINQGWGFISPEYLNFMLEFLPPGSFESCLCHLCVGMKPYTISSDAQKIDAFLKALPPAPDYAGALLQMLIEWPKVPADFILRLFEKTLPWHIKEALHDCKNWLVLIDILESLPNDKRRNMLAKGFLDILSRASLPDSYALSKTIDALNILAGNKDSAKPQKPGGFFNQILNNINEMMK